MKTISLPLGVMLLLVCFSPAGRAQFTITEAPTGLPEYGATLDNLGSQSDPLITIDSAAYYLSGAAESAAADATRPIFSSTAQPGSFDQGTYTGPIRSQYLAIGAGGSLDLNFNTPEYYFGLLWGTVDGPNNLSFYDGATLVGSVSGSQIIAGEIAAGDQYVNINSSSPFTQIVASSGNDSFEFADIAYGTAGGSSFAPSAPGTPGPPLNACMAFVAVLVLQAFRGRQKVALQESP